MDDLAGTDGGQVAVTLIGKHGLIGMGALDAGCDGGSTAVSGLLHVTGEILECEHGAADGTDTNGLVQQTQLHEDFGDQLVNDAVVAAGAVVQFHIGQALALFIYDCHITAPPSECS